MGVGSLSSARIGERIVKKRAITLQIPKTVPLSSVGNKPGVIKYTIVNANEIPNFATRTKNASSNELASLGIKAIKKPPTADIVKQSTKAVFAPKN